MTQSPEADPRPLPAWAVGAILAVPFLVAVAILRGLTVTLPIFHGGDEFNYHLPVIHRFAGELPFPNLASYPAAQTPLFHIVMAYASKIVGFHVARLRLVETLISYGLGLLVYRLLRGRMGQPQPTAVALTLLFILSPYVYGTSFRVITDNLATLFIVLALERFESFRESDRLGVFAAGCAAVGAAMLTRQSAAFMVGVAFLYGARAPLSGRQRLAALALLGLACVPAGALFLTWGGLVPPGGDPSSCGLCSGHGGAGLVAQTPELALATIGLYGALLFAPDLLRRARAAGVDRRAIDRHALTGPLLGAAAGLVLLLAFPARPGTDAAGVIWNVAGHLPSVHGTSLVFWALVPAAGAVLAWRVRLAPSAFTVVIFAACFLLGALAIRYPWQKYVDPFALLTLMLTVRRGELASLRALAGALVLALAFIAYTADSSSHANRASFDAAAPSLAPSSIGSRPGTDRRRATSRREV